MASGGAVIDVYRRSIPGHTSTTTSLLGSSVIEIRRETFLDSVGIRAILRLAKVRTEGVVLRNPQPNVRKVLDIAGIDAMGVRIDPAS
jgi:anti-anti-sigma regulatory factor